MTDLSYSSSTYHIRVTLFRSEDNTLRNTGCLVDDAGQEISPNEAVFINTLTKTAEFTGIHLIRKHSVERRSLCTAAEKDFEAGAETADGTCTFSGLKRRNLYAC